MCSLDKFGFIYGFYHENHLDLVPGKQTLVYMPKYYCLSLLIFKATRLQALGLSPERKGEEQNSHPCPFPVSLSTLLCSRLQDLATCTVGIAHGIMQLFKRFFKNEYFLNEIQRCSSGPGLPAQLNDPPLHPILLGYYCIYPSITSLFQKLFCRTIWVQVEEILHKRIFS